MNKEPLVSVITIFLDARVFLEEAVQSLLQQSYRNWQLLLVDDGSSDGSSEIARQYAMDFPDRIQYLSHPDQNNKGTGPSRNLGIQHAAGDCIAFLDSDDVWLPNKLEQQVGFLQKHPSAGMTYGNTLYWYSWTGDPEDQSRDHLPDLGVAAETLIEPPDLLPLHLSGKAAAPCPTGILIRRNVLESVDSFDEVFRGLYEDQALFAKVCLQFPVYVSGKCLEKYRQHPSSICHVAEKDGSALAVRSLYLNWLQDYLASREITDEGVWQALRAEQWQLRHPTLSRLWRAGRRLRKKARPSAIAGDTGA
jgi:glycosyltransferase involved in cell wall biosynthesis